ncbi:MAG: alpha/beta fold hydrolase [Anaerolineae bacterium]
MPTTQINETQLKYIKQGQGDPLVLVHGSWDDHHTWDMIVPDLSQTFQVLTYDRRGHSQSERPETQDSIMDDVADLANLIEEVGLAPAHVSGQSFGGSIALRLATQRPDLFRSLHVHEPPLLDLLADDPEGQKMLQEIKGRLREVEKRLVAGDMEDGARHFVETIVFGPGAWAETPPEIRQILITNAPTFLNELRDPEAFSFDLDQLRSFPHPVLLTISAEGLPFSPIIDEKLADVLPEAEQKTFSSADHNPQTSQPEAYARTIQNFFTRVTETD